MPTINVARRFALTQTVERNGQTAPETTEFAPGLHEVSDDVANHWFVVPHLATEDGARSDEIARTSALLVEANGGVSAAANASEAEGLRSELIAMESRAVRAEAELDDLKNALEAANRRADLAEQVLEEATQPSRADSKKASSK